jgi:hypothetical protein
MSSLKIYVDCLKHQDEVILDEEISCDVLNIVEKDLQMNAPVHLKGKAYLSENYLIINFSAHTSFKMCCSICNKLTQNTLSIENVYTTIDLNDIKHGIYDFTDDLRDAIILKIPQFQECNNGNCSERKNIEKYFKKTITKQSDNHFPFKDLK